MRGLGERGVGLRTLLWVVNQQIGLPALQQVAERLDILLVGLGAVEHGLGIALRRDVPESQVAHQIIRDIFRGGIGGIFERLAAFPHL